MPISPLQLASQEGHLQVVKLLARNGANIHLANNQGVTPLHVANLYGRDEVVDYLVNKGAKLEDQEKAVAKACKYCGVMDVPTMQKCSGCKVVWYCGPVCQKKDWKEGGENKHKLQCPRIKEQRELYKEKKKEEAKEEAEDINEKVGMERMRKAFEQMRRADGASSSRQG